MADIIIDATNTIVGRVGSYAAKQALGGANVKIINAEKAIMTGNKATIFAKYMHVRVERGQIRHGPYMHRGSDRFVRRIVRGMLPFEKTRGQNAYRNVMCYIGVPPELKGAKAEVLGAKANVNKLKTLNYVTISELCKHLGAKA